MSEEEKKAVDLLNKLNFSCNRYYIVENGLAKDIDYILTRNAIKTIKNLIEKQQKEINRLKDILGYIRKIVNENGEIL